MPRRPSRTPTRNTSTQAAYLALGCEDVTQLKDERATLSCRKNRELKTGKRFPIEPPRLSLAQLLATTTDNSHVENGSFHGQRECNTPDPECRSRSARL